MKNISLLLFSSLLFLLLFIPLLTGCNTLTYKRAAAKNPLSKNSVKVPVNMLDVWQPYAQTTSEGGVVRGIAGRIHFYSDAKKKRTIKVDGELTVFVFDGKETNPSRAKPMRVYKFSAKTLESHHSFKKPLGHGYDFFLPFDEIGGEEKTLCIMARFDDVLESSLLVAKPVHTILSGTKPEIKETPFQQFLANRSVLGKQEPLPGTVTKNPQPLTAPDNVAVDSAVADNVSEKKDEVIKQASFEEEAKSELKDEPKQRQATTIMLNEKMTRQMQQ